MARHTIFIYPETHEKIKAHLGALAENGATGHDVSFSGFCCKLIELGLIMYEARQNDGKDAQDPVDIQRMILENGVLTRNVVGEIVRLMSRLEEVKALNITPQIVLGGAKAKTDKEVADVYGETVDEK